MLQTVKGKQIEKGTIRFGGVNDHITVVGNLDLNGFILSSSAIPTEQYNLVNKKYADSLSGQTIIIDNDSIVYSGITLKSAIQYIQSGYTSTTGITGSISTDIQLTYTPAGNSYISVTFNGISYKVSYGDTSGMFYFGATGKSRSSLISGDILYFNATNADMILESDDLITLTYSAIFS